MERSSPPHEPSVEIIVDPNVAALVTCGPISDIIGVFEG
jgi:hypothetical protein